MTNSLTIIPNGKTVYTGRNWSQKWSRTEWIIKDGMAHPAKRHHFWCSVAGKVEDISNEMPMDVVTTSETFGTKTTHHHEIRGNGVLSFFKV